MDEKEKDEIAYGVLKNSLRYTLLQCIEKNLGQTLDDYFLEVIGINFAKEEKVREFLKSLLKEICEEQIDYLFNKFGE